MLLFKKKEKKAEEPEKSVIILPASLEEQEKVPENDEVCETAEVAEIKEETLPVSAEEICAERSPEAARGETRGKRGENNGEFAAFYELARLLNTTVENVKDECCLFQVKKLMNRLGKVIVRFNVTDAELADIIDNSAKLETSEIVLSPAYLPALIRKVGKEQLDKLNVCALIDFPFGESTFKSKITDVKDVIKLGVDGVTVMMPAMMLEKDNLKMLKAQCRKIGRAYKNRAGVAVSAMDVTEEGIKTLIKTVEKTSLSHLTFVFGEAGEEELKLKFKTIMKHKGKKCRIKILGNVMHAEAVMELFKLGAETVLTPYSDDIGADLVKRFNIKCLKLR